MCEGERRLQRVPGRRLCFDPHLLRSWTQAPAAGQGWPREMEGQGGQTLGKERSTGSGGKVGCWGAEARSCYSASRPMAARILKHFPAGWYWPLSFPHLRDLPHPTPQSSNYRVNIWPNRGPRGPCSSCPSIPAGKSLEQLPCAELGSQKQ